MAKSSAAANRAAGRRSHLDLGRLNPRQHEAVMHGDGPLLVLAGAGSGKTQVIIFRIARLIQDGIGPDKILGVTFTNKAAREMRERLVALVGKKASRVTLSTFHALGLGILKEEYEAAGLRQGFCIYDTSDQLSLVRDLMRQVKVADRRLDAQRVLDVILKTKRERRQEVELLWGDDYELAAYDLYPRYVQQMHAYNAIDFDDLLLRSQDVLGKPEVRLRWSTRYDYLLVDEYQDTSPDQLELVQVLAGDNQNVCAVGDDDQSIYAWRGAAVGNILSFGHNFPGTTEVVLDQNYRSTGNILSVANSVIKNNAARKVKVLWSAGGDGDPVEVITCSDGDDEAAFVTETIGRLAFDGTKHDDIAVLYRSNLQSRIFEETFAMERIPFRVVGGQAFFDRKEVRDAVAFLSVLHNQHDEIALRRIVNVPPRGIGAASLERLVEFGEGHGIGLWGALLRAHEVEGLPKQAALGAEQLVALLEPARERLGKAKVGELAPMVRGLLEELRLRDSILEADDAPSISQRRLENLDEVNRQVERLERSLANNEGDSEARPLEEFVRSSTLVRSGNSDDEDERLGRVTLMTLHSAKGLEFPYVFLVGMEEDLLPHKKSMEQSDGDLSEERRLCYVGMTRAKKRLWLTHVRHRIKNGKPTDRTPSRFLQEIPDGEHVRRAGRDTSVSEEDNEALADEFFKKMREKLGIS